MISHVCCMIFYMISSLIQPCQAVQMNIMQAVEPARSSIGFESNAGPSPLRLCVCPGIKIGLQWIITLYQASCRMHNYAPASLPHPHQPLCHAPPGESWLGSCLSDFCTSLYHSTSLCLMYPEYSESSTFQDPDDDLCVCSSKACSASAGLRPPTAAGVALSMELARISILSSSTAATYSARPAGMPSDANIT